MSTDLLRPHDHAEAVALFRAEVIGALARRELSRGELAADAYFAHRDHRNRRMAIAEIGHRDRSGATLFSRS